MRTLYVWQTEATMEPGRYCIISSMYMRTVSAFSVSREACLSSQATDIVHTA